MTLDVHFVEGPTAAGYLAEKGQPAAVVSSAGPAGDVIIAAHAEARWLPGVYREPPGYGGAIYSWVELRIRGGLRSGGASQVEFDLQRAGVVVPAAV